MNLILFDDHSWENLLPLTFTKPAAELRVGILVIREKWERIIGAKASWMTQDYLASKFSMEKGQDTLLLNGTLLPGKEVVSCILSLKDGEALKTGETLLAARVLQSESKSVLADLLENAQEFTGQIDLVDYPWKIFTLNGQEIVSDFQLLTDGRSSQPLSTSIRVSEPGNIFVEEGFKGEHITLNAEKGPIYLGKDTEIMEGSVIRGPFAICEHSAVKLSAKIYGPTTIGPHCKAGGEINNSVIQGYSNKGHDGFLGNAVIGEWCNLGADTNNSNLKNNYSEVKVWNYPANRFIKTGLQFCGLIMGDHSKCGINTMFNTGTVVGVSANIFGSGFPRNFIPSFSWGGAAGMSVYKTDKAFETMELVMERRGVKLTEEDRAIYQHIFEQSEKYRHRL